MIWPPSSSYRFSANGGLAVEPGVEAAADVQESARRPSPARPGRRAAGLRHLAAEDRVLGVDARHLVRVLDRPGVGLAGRRRRPLPAPASSTGRGRSGACRRRSTAQHRAVGVGRHWPGDDVEAPCPEGQIDRRVARHEVRPEHPRLSGCGGLRHDDRDGHPDAVEAEFVAVVGRREPRPRQVTNVFSLGNSR